MALAPFISSEDLLEDMCGGGDKAEAIFKTKKIRYLNYLDFPQTLTEEVAIYSYARLSQHFTSFVNDYLIVLNPN